MSTLALLEDRKPVELEHVGTCKLCGGGPWKFKGVGKTLVGCTSPPGHYHDENCHRAIYECSSGHKLSVPMRVRCTTEGCDWVGAETCFCHPGIKLFREDIDRALGVGVPSSQEAT